MAHTINDPVITVTIPTTPSPTVLDLTDDCASVTFDGQRGVVSRPLFGSAGQNRAVKGLFDGTITLELNQDYAGAGALTNMLWDAMIADDLVEIAVRAKDAAVSETNPEWQCQVAVESFAAFDGGAGELATTTLTLPIHGLPDRVVTPES